MADRRSSTSEGGGMESFEYVIVGAGSAGCVLANRLSTDSAVRVLLLEAGPADDAPQIHMPGASFSMFKTELDWDYTTVPLAATGHRQYMPRGRMLGGSSSINAMIYMRGNPADYDHWRDGFGAQGWGYADLLPYFVRAEDNARLAGPVHGQGGPLRVEDPLEIHELQHAWLDAAVKWGLPVNDDFNSGTQIGVGPYQLTCRDGRRWSTADAYLRPALDRDNLVVRTGAVTSRIVLERGRARGVVYRNETGEHTVAAEAEVLVCTGAIGSPQLLMLSGIGPADQLRGLGLDVAVDLPGVGENLHDHPTAGVAWATKGTTDLGQLAATAEAAEQWQREHRGPLASNFADAGGFLATDGHPDLPDIQFYPVATGYHDNALRPVPMAGFTVAATLITPRSRGRLQLASSDPTAKPEIDLGFYQDPADFDALLAGTRALLDIARCEPLAGFLDTPYLPDVANPDEEVLAAHIRRWTQTMYHPAGTCAMGTDERAVVDPQLHVRGVEGLRVIDASVMPSPLRGNTNAPTITIAEKASDLLRI
jgi:choline dehydrogenase